MAHMLTHEPENYLKGSQGESQARLILFDFRRVLGNLPEDV